jgi:hypothetical protein
MLAKGRLVSVVGVFMLVAAGPTAQAANEPAAFHVVATSRRIYMGFARDRSYELWLTSGRAWIKSGARVTIKREDLALTWSIDEGKQTYAEEKDDSASPPKQDIHTFGFHREPVFDWSVETRETTREIGGYACRAMSCHGEDDYSDATVTLWTTPTHSFGDVSLINEALLVLLNYEAETEKARELLRSEPGMLIVEVELVREAPIAPRVVTTVSVKTIERMSPPAGIFELPAGFSKATD